MFIWIQKLHSSSFTNDWVWCIAAAPLRMPSCRWICCSWCRLFSGSLIAQREIKKNRIHAASILVLWCFKCVALLVPCLPCPCDVFRVPSDASWEDEASKAAEARRSALNSCCMRSWKWRENKLKQKKRSKLKNLIDLNLIEFEKITDNYDCAAHRWQSKLTLGSPSWTCLSFSDRSKRSLADPLQLL